MFGRATLNTKPVRWVADWIAKNPGKTAAAASLLLDQIIEWIIGYTRHNKVDVESLVTALKRSIPSVPWSTDRDKLIVQMKDYATRSPSARAALFQALNEAGFKIALPGEIMGFLLEAPASEQDRLLIDAFKASADAAIPSAADVTPPFEVVLLRTKLVQRASRVVGGFDNLQVLRAAVLTLDDADIERAKEVEQVQG